MDANPQPSGTPHPPSPTELLAAQTQSLSELVEIQKAQQGQITELQRQNERVIGLLAEGKTESPKAGLTHVKIENVNMPFGALVGFLIKVSLASIPAMLILAMIYFVIIFVLSLFGLALGGIFNR